VKGFTPRSPRDNGLLSNRVSPGYFRLMGTPFRAGRDFDAGDTVDSLRVVIINDAAMRKFFHGRDPIGRLITLDIGPDAWQPLTVVGVVRDTAYQTLRETPPPLMFFPVSQQDRPGTFLTFVARTQGETTSLARAVAAAGGTVNRNITVELRTLETQLADSIIQERLLAALSGFFGTLALLIAAIGLYGLMSLAVRRRRNELGVRMALGADAGGIVRLVLRDVAVVTGFGLIGGSVLAFASSRLITSLLYGLTPTDPTTAILAVTLLSGVAALAGYVPARRAARLDPMIALRDD
jgi:putative ABC transport system permease protein